MYASPHGSSNGGPSPGISFRKAALAAGCGIAFGFLLQKGGLAKYNVLIGQLLLQDFTVIKTMLTAIVTGMAGIFLLERFGKVSLQLEPVRLGAQGIGGVIFGVGFGLLAYCPGTGAVALGQTSWDVLFGIAGLIAGSYLYAEFSAPLGRTVRTWGTLGKQTIPGLLRLPRLPFALATAALLGGILLVLAHLS
jgi:hypothetical protein